MKYEYAGNWPKNEKIKQKWNMNMLEINQKMKYNYEIYHESKLWFWRL